MKVCIAEKPSVAGEIAKIIGANSRKNGYYEGNGYQVTWTYGHLCGLQEPHEYTDKWKYWNLMYLPMIPPTFRIKVIDDSGIQRQFNVIKSLVETAEEVINCGDAGQEGELIQRWVLQKANCRVPVKRLWISSLTEEAIKEGFVKLKDAENFNNLYAAGSARAIGDWLLGMNATRAYTLKYGKNEKGKKNSVLSIGRVQTPTLALIVKRQDEIENFVSEPFWELKTIYRDVSFNSQLGKIKTIEEANKQLESIKGRDIEIVDITTKNAKERPPKLFDLTSLQVECNKKYDFSAEETLKIIQSLYEKKLTTYPRVDTTYLPNDMYDKIPGILKVLEPYKNFTEPLLGKKLKKTKQTFDDKKITDHHAIIPTNVFNHNMTKNEKYVYDLVARRFIATFYPDCKIANTTVFGEINNVESKIIKFKATGKIIVDKGWRVVFDITSEDTILPEFIVHEKGAQNPKIVEKQTSPPKSYSEASLLRAMETAGKDVEDDSLRDVMKQNGIGRPSTRANIIETLYKRKYIQKQKKKIEATPTGKDLINTIKYDLLKSVELTGLWEKKLREIELGEYSVKNFMDEMKEMVSDVVVNVKQSESKTIVSVSDEKDATKGEKVKKRKNVDIDNLVCPRCKKAKFVKGKKAWGCLDYAKGCKTVIPFSFMGKPLTDKQIKDLCIKGKTSKLKGFIDENGDEKEGVVKLNSDFTLSLG
ncbi:type IA DNA topoisomerase [Marinilabiliaceae bacterium JC040]|nr:type IA DNA topoisomerase [Marinilabiliaceae bacterium JC040]